RCLGCARTARFLTGRQRSETSLRRRSRRSGGLGRRDGLTASGPDLSNATTEELSLATRHPLQKIVQRLEEDAVARGFDRAHRVDQPLLRFHDANAEPLLAGGELFDLF